MTDTINNAVMELEFITGIVARPTEYDVAFTSDIGHVTLDEEIHAIENAGVRVEVLRMAYSSGFTFYCTYTR